jgi:chaperone modulatory protein CbpM
MKKQTQIKIHHAVIVDETITFTIAELCQSCNIDAELINEMVEHGVLDPLGKTPAEWYFQNQSLQRIQTTLRLQHDLGINLSGAALVLELMEELKQLRAKLARLD